MYSGTGVSKWIVLVWINWSSATSISDGILYHGFFWRKIFVSRDVLSWHFQTQYCQKVWTELSNFEELVSTSRRHKKLFTDANCFQFCWQHSSLTMCNCNVRINLCQSCVGFQVDSDETDVKANFKRQTKVKFITWTFDFKGFLIKIMDLEISPWAPPLHWMVEASVSNKSTLVFERTGKVS